MFVALYRAVHLPAGGHDVIGHEVAYSETNNRHLIAVCACGWIGTPTTWRTDTNPKTKRQSINFLSTVEVCEREHAQHLENRRESIAALSGRIIERNARAVDKVIPIVLRPGRFGSG